MDCLVVALYIVIRIPLWNEVRAKVTEIRNYSTEIEVVKQNMTQRE